MVRIQPFTDGSIVAELSHVPLQEGVPEFLQDTIRNIVAFLPRLVGALIILLIGWIIGRVLGGVVERLVARSGLDSRVSDTAIGRFVGGRDRAVADALGKITAYYIYLLAIVAAANALAIPALSEWVARAVSYVPALIAGLLIIIVGFVVADFIGDAVERSESVTENRFTSIFADGIRFFLYFVVLTIGLSTMGVDTRILYILAEAVAYGLGAAIAIGVGVAIGLGAKDYVSAHIDDWMGTAKEGARTRADRHSSSGTGSPPTGSTSDTTTTESETFTEDRSDRDTGPGSGTGTPSGE